jgi:hypothetical protein
MESNGFDTTCNSYVLIEAVIEGKYGKEREKE